METLVTDLEYAADMALLADSWNDLETMLTTLSTHCFAFGLSISCSKTKTMAVLPASHCAPPDPIHLFPTIPLLNLSPVSSIWDASIMRTVGLTWRSTPGSARLLKPLAVSVVSSGTRRKSTLRQASHFQFCHHPQSALWHRMCCVVAAAYPSLAKFHHALFANNPGYLCLGYEA